MPRAKPEKRKVEVFIGSTVKGLPIAKLIVEELSHDFHCSLWTKFFDPGNTNMDALENALSNCSYAIIVMTPDDKSVVKGKRHLAPRNNLIFELGLFAGRHGKQASLMVTPRGENILLPTDLLGINTAEYEVRSRNDQPAYDVTAACNKISRVIDEAERKRTTELGRKPEEISFWNGLSDTVRIIYGVESAKGPGSKVHAQVSLRDLATAHRIFGFLNRTYPHKLIYLFPSSTPQYSALPENEDLIFVGGFVTNDMFGYLHLQSRFEADNHFRVKLGRICGLEGRGGRDKRVLHPIFDGTRLVPPPRTDPQAIDVFPSEETRRDFGRIFSAKIDIYGGLRRVITFAGVKGHGTHGAARALTQDASLNRLLPASMKGNERIEMIVAADVKDDVVVQAIPVEIVVNGKRSYLSHDPSLWQPCEQINPCNECTFGVPRKYQPAALVRAEARPAGQLKAIVFDLDDTLVDTFGSFIVPLETAAAQRMFETGIANSVDNIVEVLRHLRMTNPGDMEHLFPRRFHSVQKKTLEQAVKIWKDINTSPMSLNRLRELGGKISQYQIGPELRLMLEEMSDRYALYLLTAGDPVFQNEKIDHLGIRDLFGPNILIVNAGTEETKREKMGELLALQGYESRSVVVVGNRVDHEIQAGIELGLTTVWLRKGEGSAIKQKQSSEQPDWIIEDIMELEECLGSIEAGRALALEEKKDQKGRPSKRLTRL